jgi:hypothetical protein
MKFETFRQRSSHMGLHKRQQLGSSTPIAKRSRTGGKGGQSRLLSGDQDMMGQFGQLLRTVAEVL